MPKKTLYKQTKSERISDLEVRLAMVEQVLCNAGLGIYRQERGKLSDCGKTCYQTGCHGPCVNKVGHIGLCFCKDADAVDD